MKFTVMRAFFLDGNVQGVGGVVDIIDRALAGGLQSSGKVQIAAENTAPEASGPMTTETSGLVAGPVHRARTGRFG